MKDAEYKERFTGTTLIFRLAAKEGWDAFGKMVEAKMSEIENKTAYQNAVEAWIGLKNWLKERGGG